MADMKAAAVVFLLTACSAVMHAQNSATTSGDVAIRISAGAPDYCLGPFASNRGPDDITLRLRVRLRFDNHGSQTIFIPHGYRFIWRMTVDGQNEPTILRRGGGGSDVKSLMALSRPEAGPFWTVPGGKAPSSTAPELTVLKLPGTVYDEEFVTIPVLVRSSGLDLRGKTVHIATTRDFSSITPDVVEKLNEKWKDYGTVWARVVESETMTLRIPEEPLTRNCLKQ